MGVKVIATITPESHSKYFEKGGIKKIFTPLKLDGPNTKESFLMINEKKSFLENHYNISINDNVIKKSIELSEKYVSDRYLPGKAIDILEQGLSKVNINKQKIENAKLKMELSRESGNWAEMSRIQYGVLPQLKNNETKLTGEVIEKVVSNATGIPVEKVQGNEKDKLLGLRNHLAKKVIGQDEAVCVIADSVIASRSGVSEKRSVSYLFTGPTGTGKTFLSKLIAEHIFNGSLVRIDCSELVEQQSVAKLVGSIPGYILSEEGGMLTNKVRANPYSLILFDEIEKAHPSIYNLLLQVMSDSHLTDSRGITVDFSNCLIVFTSNLKNIENHFSPEFINRLDEVITFSPLTKENMVQICENELAILSTRVMENLGIEICITNDLHKFLIEKGFSDKYGARPLRRLIYKMIEVPLSRMVVRGEIKKEGVVIDLN